MYNIISLILGLGAWTLGICGILKRDCLRQVFGSLLCCAGALLSQLMDVKRLVSMGDWAALLDTIDVVVFAAMVLTLVTAALNTIAVMRKRR